MQLIRTTMRRFKNWRSTISSLLSVCSKILKVSFKLAINVRSNTTSISSLLDRLSEFQCYRESSRLGRRESDESSNQKETKNFNVKRTTTNFSFKVSNTKRQPNSSQPKNYARNPSSSPRQARSSQRCNGT